MKKWLRFMRGPVGMVLSWAAGWAIVGMTVELVLNLVPGPDGYVVDMWPQAMALAGILAGAIFFTLLRVAGGSHAFDELPIHRIGALGAVTGLILSVLAVRIGVASDVLPGLWPRAAVVVVSLTLLGAVSALVLITLTRFVEQRKPAGTSLFN